jgi:fructose/tagatose bisphosphate aldolase
MPLVPNAVMIKAAVEGGYAVPHFNVCNLETVLAVADVAEELKTPVIFGVHPIESAYAGNQNMGRLDFLGCTKPRRHGRPPPGP